MGMTIKELIAFCEEEEYNHRLNCKRYDDASGYTRSKDKNIRTACAIREDTYADFYKEISDTMRKYQRIQAIVKEWREVGLDYDSCDAMDNIERVIENGSDKRL